jgi:hypothetical protein
MKTISNWMMMLAIAATSLILCGCGSFWGGAAGGAAGTGAGYEYNAHKQIERLNEDLKNGKIDQKEYDIRKNQIERGSIVY